MELELTQLELLLKMAEANLDIAEVELEYAANSLLDAQIAVTKLKIRIAKET